MRVLNNLETRQMGSGKWNSTRFYYTERIRRGQKMRLSRKDNLYSSEHHISPGVCVGQPCRADQQDKDTEVWWEERRSRCVHSKQTSQKLRKTFIVSAYPSLYPFLWVITTQFFLWSRTPLIWCGLGETKCPTILEVGMSVKLKENTSWDPNQCTFVADNS